MFSSTDKIEVKKIQLKKSSEGIIFLIVLRRTEKSMKNNPQG